jgi:dihydrodipicolinate synthetase family protein
MPQRGTTMTRFSGVWLPAITPFEDGEIAYASYERLVDHYVRVGVAGIIPLGTTGESPTIDEAESAALVERTVAVVAGRVPVVVGLGGNDTRKVVKAVKHLECHRRSARNARSPPARSAPPAGHCRASVGRKDGMRRLASRLTWWNMPPHDSTRAERGISSPQAMAGAGGGRGLELDGDPPPSGR